MHVWVVSEDKWCSFCGALLGSWLKSFGSGYFRNSVYSRLYGVWRVVAVGKEGRHFVSLGLKILIVTAETP